MQIGVALAIPMVVVVLVLVAGLAVESWVKWRKRLPRGDTMVPRKRRERSTPPFDLHFRVD